MAFGMLLYCHCFAHCTPARGPCLNTSLVGIPVTSSHSIAPDVARIQDTLNAAE